MQAGIGSKATESVRSSVTMLSAIKPSLNASEVLNALAKHYCTAYNTVCWRLYTLLQFTAKTSTDTAYIIA